MSQIMRQVGSLPNPDQWRWELDARGLGAEEFARLAGVSRPTVTRVLRGKPVRRSTIDVLEEALAKIPVNRRRMRLIQLQAS